MLHVKIIVLELNEKSCKTLLKFILHVINIYIYNSDDQYIKYVLK